jgi:hypothetical protein
MRNRLTILAGAAIALWGCSSEAMLPAPYVGVPGAGIKAEIVGVIPQTGGYQFKVTTTNLDVTALQFNSDCDWGVDQLVDGNWVSLYRRIGPCYDSVFSSLEPGEVYPQTFTLKTAALPAGTVVRLMTGSYETAPITL